MTTFMIFEFDEKYGADHLKIIIGCVALMKALLYFDKTQNVNVNLLICACRPTSTAQNN